MAEKNAIAGRSIWTGTLTFGLVSIPVNLLSAVKPRNTAMHMFDDEGAPLGRRYYCSVDGRELDRSDLVRGYETDKSVFVTVEDEELEGLQPEKTSDIDLKRFVPRQSISSLYFDRPYFLFPAGKSVKAYRLLAKVLEDEDTAGIATFVMRGREYLVAILSGQGILWAETLRFADELRDPAEIDLPEMHSDAKQVKAMEKAIDALYEKKVPMDYLRDRYAERLTRLVNRKRKRGKEVARTEAVEEEKDSEQVDLMKMLKQRIMEEET
ncbi:MAG: Ku protein [Desulfobulbaceae bacterium]|nr:Ku protein [Desulfobulbaceae bacterium]